MGTRDPRVDAYIESSADFARPILLHLRETVHAACPTVQETIKWGFPHFTYEGILCSMAAFSAHCAFGFWKGALVLGDDAAEARTAMGHFGRIASLRDLPPRRTLVRYIRRAMALNEAGVKSPTRGTRAAKAAPVVPDYLAEALAKNRKARATFEAFSPSHRREYIEWLTEAKREETRKRRLATALEWLAEGKPHNWKYVRK